MAHESEILPLPRLLAEQYLETQYELFALADYNAIRKFLIQCGYKVTTITTSNGSTIQKIVPDNLSKIANYIKALKEE